MHFDELPPEIIQHVFSLCCGSVRFRLPQPDRNLSGTTQGTLSLVCSRWREIALNTSVLWGDVLVNYDAGRERTKGLAASFQYVHIWLNRARMTPISLSIFVYAALESQIAAISQALSSFRVTNLFLESFDCFLPVLPATNSYYIEKLHLSVYVPGRTADAFPRLPEMSSLKELHLCMDPNVFGDFTNIYSIPWHQLRVFTLSEYRWPSQTLFNILHRCKSLVECALWMELDHEQQDHHIVLPNLENLMLDMNSGGIADPIIRSLTLPNLKMLEIRSWKRYSIMPLNLEAVIIMGERSGFNKRLTDLSLAFSLMKEPIDVRSLLGSMPALKSLQLLGPLIFQPGTFDDLSSGTIGPHLEEIYFGVMSDEEIAQLLEAVSQRHHKAKTASDIRPFAFVTSHCTSESDIESHKQRARQCSEAFDARVEIVKDSSLLRAVLTGALVDSDESDSVSDLSTGLTSDDESYIDEELGSISGAMFISDEEPLEESISDEESHSLEGSESQGTHSFEDSSSDEQSDWESDADVGSHSPSGEESHDDSGADIQSDGSDWSS